MTPRLALPSFRRRRLLIAVIAAVLLLVAFAPSRHAGLRAAGGWLVHHDVPVAADVILLLSGSGPDALLETAQLAKEFPAARVLMFASVDPVLEAEFRNRGANVPTESDLARLTLVALGIPPERIVIERLPSGGTRRELAAWRTFLSTDGAVAPVVVSSWHHSRRALRLLRREFGAARPLIVIPRGDVDSARDWWQHRDSLRVGLVELQKLAVDVAAHPFS